MTDGALSAPPPISTISGAPQNPVPDSEMDALLLGRTRELVTVSPGQRNWRGIFIALLVIAGVLGLIVFSIFLLSPEYENFRIKGRRLTLSDISGTSLKWKTFNGTWISDVELVYRDLSGGLSILNLFFENITVLMTNSTFRQLNADKFIISPDVKFVLLASDHNVANGASRYHVYEVQTRNTFALSPQEGSGNPPRLQRVLWAPNINAAKLSAVTQTIEMQNSPMGGTIGGSMAGGGIGGKIVSQAIAFVHENDLYYKPKVQSDLVCRITTTGQRGVVYNGIPNWMYSNVPELQSETLAFSPDGMFLSYLMFNDSLVKEYQYAWVGDNVKYPTVKTIRYPKTSSINPNVTVFVANLSILKYIVTQQVRLPSHIRNGSYIGAMVWVSPVDLSITVTDREQTSASTVLCRAPTFNCREIHVETILDNGWVVPAEAPIYSKLQTQFKHSTGKPPIVVTTTTAATILLPAEASLPPLLEPFNRTTWWVPTTVPQNETLPNASMENEFEFESGGYLLKRLPVRDGDHGFYRHVVFVSPSDQRTVPITMGRFEVTEILGWNEANETVYFMAAPESKPGQRHLYRINLRLNATEKSTRVYITSTQPVCMTCDNSWASFNLASNLTIESNLDDFEIPNNCLYNRIQFSKGYNYYVQECLGPDTPSTYLVETRTNHKLVVLNSGDSLRERLYHLATPQIRIFNVEIRHGFQAQVRLYLPPGMKEEEEIAFPMILQVDAAPGSQLVSEMYDVDWNWYLCSQKSMIVAQIDARGSGYQGELMRSQVKGRLGTVDIEDQLGVLTYLQQNLKFVDPSRICAYGWGYGGYAVAMTLTEDSQDVLRCAVSINPIVSFAYHNSFFTERYIPQTEDYLRAIQDSDLIIRAGNIKSRNFLLIHGTADTLVHPHHSLMLARALIDRDVIFRHQVYTDEDHKLSNVRHHLYKTMENYFEESFGPLETTDWDPTGFFAFKQ